MPGFSGHSGRPVYRQPAPRPQVDASLAPLLPTNAQTLSVTATIVVSLVKRAQLVKTLAVAAVATLIRFVAVSRTVLVSPVVILTKQAQVIRGSIVATANLARVTQANLVKLCAVTPASSLAHQVGKVESVTVAVLVSLTKQDQKILPTIGTAIVVTYTSIKVIIRNFSITVGASVSLIKQAQKPFVLTVGGLLTLTKTAQKALTTIVVSTLVTFSSIKVILRTFSVTVGVSLTRTTQAQLVKTIAVGALAALAKAVRATRAMIAASPVVTMAKQDQATRSVNAGGSLALSRQDQKLYAVTGAVQTTVGKAISAVRRLVATILATFTASGGTVVTTRSRSIALIGSVNTAATLLAFPATAPALTGVASTAVSLAARSGPQTLIGSVNTTQNWTAAA